MGDLQQRARPRLEQRLDEILRHLPLVEDRLEVLNVGRLIRVRGETEARGLGADIDVVLLRQLAHLLDEGREVEERVGAGRRDAGFLQALGRGAVALGEQEPVPVW